MNARDHEGNTALHFAAEAGKGKVCQLLIQFGASPGQTNSNKKTPMDMASSDYIREIIIVSNPANQFVPSKEDLKELEICGVETKPRPVRNLP